MTNWHTNEISQLLTELESSTENGLTATQVTDRTTQFGHNEFIERGGLKPLQMLWEQLTATMVLILLAAALTTGWLGATKNTIAILAAAALYAFLGFIQEYRAEKAVAALKKMSVPKVRVLRAGEFQELYARELVPGDIIQLETGNMIPADLRLLEAVNLRIQEAALSGEAEAIEKHTATLSGDDLPLGDRRNMGYMGSMVTQGRGLALVVATGMQTELGKIADLIQQVKQEKTPLQRRLDVLGKNLAFIGLAVVALIFVLGMLRGSELRHLLLAAVSVAVAIVPESLPAVVAVTLTLGAQRMMQRKALIRKLPAVETLGSVTVICSDKTGTLTENRMTVVVLDVADHELDLTEEVERNGTLRTTRELGIPVQSSLSLAAIGGALCNDAKLVDIGDERYHTLGDPTEGAMVVAAAKIGYWKSSLDSSFPRAAELPFDSERKRMTTVHHLERYDPAVLAGLEVGARRYIAFTKGSVDGLLDISTHVWVEGQAQLLDAESRSKIEAANESLIKKGMRVLGVAFRMFDSIPEVIQMDLEQSLTFVGLFGMIDPPRNEVKDAVAVCRGAGIRPVMITGDHPSTAIEIARQLGISDNGRALTGLEIENLTFDELKNAVEDVNVFARVAPEHKLKIVRALQENGHIVSMTGDGVNDAPALRRADIGVAMGITGSDVSKEASDLVLLDDNFATIVTAVREGRSVSDNIRRFIHFSVAGNIGMVLVMLIAPFLGHALPLLPLQLLWLNVLTAGLLGLGIGVEKSETDTMKREAHSIKEGVFSHAAGRQTIWIGILIGLLAIGLGSWFYSTGRPEWQTMIFTSLAFMQIFQALASRSAKESLFKAGLLSNPLLAGMAALAVVLQLIVIYLPVLGKFFGVIPISACDLSIAASTGVIVFVTMELAKRREK
jgi:P-type Ca2+ transporter type 2C